MRLGELKLACLQLMHDLDSTKTVDELAILEKGELGDRISKLTDSINRAIDYILSSGVINTQTEEIAAYNLKDNRHYIKYGLNEIASDIYKINKINYEGENGEYENDIDYRYEGDKCILLENRRNTKGVYLIVYTKDISRVSSKSSNSMEIELKDEVTRLIPYFVKGELYDEDEPNLAIQSHNKFINGLSNILLNKPAEKTHLDIIFKGDW